MALSLEGWGRQYSDMIKEGGRKNLNREGGWVKQKAATPRSDSGRKSEIA